MTGKGFLNSANRCLRWAASALLLTAGWSADGARAQTGPATASAADKSPEVRLLETAAAIESTPKPLPASVQKTSEDSKKEVKTDPNVVPAGCSSCGGGLLGAGPVDVDTLGCTCGGPACVPGRLHCCSACCSDTCIGKILCGLYDCVCCPDPCYEPHWVAAANAAFFVDAARPVTQTMLRYDGMFDVQHPDRNEFFIPRSGASNNFNMLSNRPPCTPTGFGKGPNYVARNADIEELTMRVEGAIDKLGIFIDTPYREFGPEGSAVNLALGTPGNLLAIANNVCNTSGFSDIVIGTKSLWLDCELLQVAFQFKTFLPTGNFLSNLGTGHVSLEPSLLFALKLSPDTYLQAQTAYWIPIGGDPLYEGDVFHAHFSFNQILCRILPDVYLIGTLESNVWATNGGNFTSEKLAFQAGNPGTPVLDARGNPTGMTTGATSGVATALPEGGSEFMFSAGPGIRLNICDRIDFGVGTAFAFTGPRWAKEEVRAEFRWRF
jgi:hypothetical protein